MESHTKKLLDFIDKSPVGLFAIDNMIRSFEAAGFIRLYENRDWNIERGKDYFTVRDQAAIAAFRVPARDDFSAMIMTSHADSPMLRIKPNPEITESDKYVKLNVEKYGGAILNSWFDRPLSVAGRIVIDTGDVLTSKLVCVDRDLLIIPSLAIHMDKTANEGHKINIQDEMLPLFSAVSPTGEKPSLLDAVAESAGVSASSIKDYDLYLYNRQLGTVFGANNEFIASGRLDDLECAYASMEGLLSAKRSESLAMHCVFYNEEVGSSTKQGAGSTFLVDVLKRVFRSLGKNEDDYIKCVSESFMVSADNAHSLHPDYASKTDPTNRPVMNGGPVLKYNADQKYATDAVSGAIFKKLCEHVNVPVQTFVNRSDMPGGSTLGNISSTRVPLLTADIGLAQLSMHSSYETAGAYDVDYLITVARALFESSLKRENDDYILSFKNTSEEL